MTDLAIKTVIAMALIIGWSALGCLFGWLIVKGIM
jgi:hypothetical protein